MKNEHNIKIGNEYLFDRWQLRKDILTKTPHKIYPWWVKPCLVRILLVTDGGLDFSDADFGMSAFVDILKNENRSYARFEISLAHMSSGVLDSQVQVGEAKIKRSIKGMDFENPDHFQPSWYDQIWFFGISSGGSSLNPNELSILSSFMNDGGGVFATGDHGSLGRALCGSLPRVRSMRYWDNASGNVGMSDPQRNDTNTNGHDFGSQFDDQSDDIPQYIQPKLYSGYTGSFWRETYPHPLLCSPAGIINVLPDHPHEGECKVPDDTGLTYLDGTPEYPGIVVPEIIAFSKVPPGNTAGSKQATQAQTFGAICAYDGHKASIGRVVTEATWHHYTNINLIGEQFDFEGNRGTTEHESKLMGFLYSTQGQKHLQKIKDYFINIAIWISRPKQQRCFNRYLTWNLVFSHRILEATMNQPELDIDKIKPSPLYQIGRHALDVIGRRAGQCAKFRILIPVFEERPDLIPSIDPWGGKPEINPDPVPWFDLNPMFAISLGRGLLSIRDEIGLNPTKASEKMVEQAWKSFRKGADQGIDIAMNSFGESLSNTFKKRKG